MSENEDAAPRRVSVIHVFSSEIIKIYDADGDVTTWRRTFDHFLAGEGGILSMSAELSRMVRDALVGARPFEIPYTSADLKEIPQTDSTPLDQEGMDKIDNGVPRKKSVICVHDAGYIELFNWLGRVSRWRRTDVTHLLEPLNDLTQPLHLTADLVEKITAAINGDGPTEIPFTIADITAGKLVEDDSDEIMNVVDRPLSWALSHAFDLIDRGDLELGNLTMCARLVLLAVAKFAADEIRAGKPVTSAPKRNLRKALSTAHDYEIDNAVHLLLDNGLLIQDRSGVGLFRLPDAAYKDKES